MNIHNNIFFRKATNTDLPKVYEFIIELEEEKMDFGKFEEIYLQNLQVSNIIYLIAEDMNTKETIGFLSCHGQCLLHHNGWVYEIQEFYIQEAYRNSGIGKSMLSELKKRLPENTVSLEVTAQNKRIATHQFYQSAGFVATHLKLTQGC